MKEIELIKEKINRIPRGKPFVMKTINSASYANVRQVLARLVKSGEVMRATRGIYVRPKEVAYLGKVLPSSNEIVKVISEQTGEVITPHGAEAARMLQLSTQAPMRPIFYTSGTSRKITVGKQIITLKHVSPRKQIKPQTRVGLVISSLWYLGKDHISEGAIETIKHQLSEKEFIELLNCSNQMPAWMIICLKKYGEK